MSRSRKAGPDASFDADLADLPEPMRWREWMGRVEAAIFSARDPVPRETLARLVGQGCNLDELLADIVDELRGRPYDIVFVAGGWQFRTRSRFAGAIRAAGAGMLRDGGAPELTPTELLALTAIAYLQPVPRAELSWLAAREISRDVIGRLKRLDLIDGALRAPEPGAPFTYVTSRKFLEAFGLASLRELPDLERLEDEGLLQRPSTDGDLDGILIRTGVRRRAGDGRGRRRLRRRGWTSIGGLLSLALSACGRRGRVSNRRARRFRARCEKGACHRRVLHAKRCRPGRRVDQLGSSETLCVKGTRGGDRDTERVYEGSGLVEFDATSKRTWTMRSKI